jgi:hypothetical protein
MFWQSFYAKLTHVKEIDCGSSSFNATEDRKLITGCPAPAPPAGWVFVPRLWIEALIL